MNDETEVEAAPRAGGAARRGGLVIAVLIAASLAWYLASDRYAPYTDQARVQGYVIAIAPEVSGRVTRVLVANNDEVEAGQPLFEVDDSQYRIALARAESDLANARSQVQAGDAAVEAARASLRAAEASALRARKDYERLSRLREDDPGTISLRRLEGSQASLDQALARVTAAQADIQRAIEQKGGDDEAENAILLAAQASVEKARLDLERTVVRAASRGLVTDLRADVGQYAGTGAPVMTLIAIHDLWISANFTENNLGHMLDGSPAELVFDAVPGRVFAGRVRSVGLGVSSGQAPPPGTLPSVSNSRDWLRQAQRFPVEVGFAADDPQLRRQLRIGGQASVIVYSDEAALTRWLGRLYIRLMSWLSYAY
ncbi:MAG: HlyD family secretion protein [Halieaceae bacterium]|jgi:multidrug resistance efflux pump|nr:HlyD family secretion protein [Halieaceae bacterium]